MSFGVTELMIIAVIVLLLFGTTKLKSLGSDLGSAIKGFKSAMGDEDKADAGTTENAQLKADEPTPIPGTTETSQQSAHQDSQQKNDS